jgi:hypothetical protein
LTPVPVGTPEPQLSDVARQAGANPITVPSTNPSAVPSFAAGEGSPTGVQDLIIYPSWTDAKDPPSWYTKGADVDALLDVADSLDWLIDTGDLNETYQPPEGDLSRSIDSKMMLMRCDFMGSSNAMNNSTSVCTLPHVDSNVESVVPPLPSLFEGTSSSDVRLIKSHHHMSNDKTMLVSRLSEPDMHDFEVFDSPMEEHDFVATILETKSCDNLLLEGED